MTGGGGVLQASEWMRRGIFWQAGMSVTALILREVLVMGQEDFSIGWARMAKSGQVKSVDGGILGTGLGACRG